MTLSDLAECTLRGDTSSTSDAAKERRAYWHGLYGNEVSFSALLLDILVSPRYFAQGHLSQGNAISEPGATVYKGRKVKLCIERKYESSCLMSPNCPEATFLLSFSISGHLLTCSSATRNL